MSRRAPTLLVLIHASWEMPHRVLDACGEAKVMTVRALEGEPLLRHEEVDGALAMGGPMNVDDVERHPALAEERDWISEAVGRQMPVLGICLGAQLVARALGAAVRPGEAPEIGFAPIAVHDPDDPIVGALAPSTEVLHWHGDVFDLPRGAVPLASSARTEHQAFRSGSAWGVLFHPEADNELVDTWLAEPVMLAEAEAALGPEAATKIRTQARAAEPDLVKRSTPGFRAFADLLSAR